MSLITQVRRLAARLQSTVTRAVVTRINDSTATQTIQVELRFDDIADAVEHFQPFGLSFHPTSDSECIVLAVGASQDDMVAIAATNRSHRPNDAESGEGGLYTPSGWKIFLNKNDEVCVAEKEPVDWIARADRVDQMFNAVVLALQAGAGSAVKQDGGAAAMTAAKETLDGFLQPTKSDKGRVT